MFDVLQTILPIPSAPVQNDERALRHNERVLGIRFPPDFVDYSCIYGSGEICDDTYRWEVIGRASPSCPTFVSEFRKTFSQLRDAYQPYTIPFHLYPEPDGLLPFGFCANGVWWCWKTCGMPETWTVVDIRDWNDDGYRSYAMGFSEFLVKLFRAQIQLPFKTLNSDPTKVVTFIPKEQ